VCNVISEVILPHVIHRNGGASVTVQQPVSKQNSHHLKLLTKLLIMRLAKYGGRFVKVILAP
jgi:hypothetical protein